MKLLEIIEPVAIYSTFDAVIKQSIGLYLNCFITLLDKSEVEESEIDLYWPPSKEELERRAEEKKALDDKKNEQLKKEQEEENAWPANEKAAKQRERAAQK